MAPQPRLRHGRWPPFTTKFHPQASLGENSVATCALVNQRVGGAPPMLPSVARSCPASAAQNLVSPWIAVPGAGGGAIGDVIDRHVEPGALVGRSGRAFGRYSAWASPCPCSPWCSRLGQRSVGGPSSKGIVALATPCPSRRLASRAMGAHASHSGRCPMELLIPCMLASTAVRWKTALAGGPFGQRTFQPDVGTSPLW